MNTDAILPTPIQFSGRDGREYSIQSLTKSYFSKHATVLTSLHGLIPYVGDKLDDMAKDNDDNNRQLFIYKWNISVAVEHNGRPVGFLIAYVRDYSERHPFRSVYIHRMAVARSHQRNFVGCHTLASAVSLYFEALPWLLTITLQTNDETANAAVLNFYRRFGFNHAYRVEYPDKIDSLMDLERTNSMGPGAMIPGFDPLRVPARPPALNRLPNPFDQPSTLDSRVVYFGTTSREKLTQYRFLGRSYGLRLQRLQHNLSLTEPQIETQGGPSAESALVAAPLKLFSRFAAKTIVFPIMVEDTMLFIEHFNKDYANHLILPGPDTKRWWFALGAEGVLRLLGKSKRRAAKYVCQIGINSAPGQYAYFRSELAGRISDATHVAADSEINFPYTNPTFFHSIFIPDGSERCLAEMDANEFLAHDYRRACFSQTLTVLQESAAAVSQLDLFAD